MENLWRKLVDCGNKSAGTPAHADAETLLFSALQIICAHYDTMYNTKGAYDNCSGTILAIELARALSANPLEHGIDIVLMDAEEHRLAGAMHYVAQTTPGTISCVINIDGIGRGDVLEIWSGPESFEKHIIETLANDTIFPNKTFINPPPPGSDHAPFYDLQIPSCMFTINDQDIIHTPRDIAQEDILVNMQKIRQFLLDNIPLLLNNAHS